ncbi:MAG: type VI secretion system tip protein TssI/VgrG [Byssovorax sp.]
MASIYIELGCAALPDGFRVVTSRGVEAINALSRWEIGIVLESAPVDAESVIGAPAALRLVDDDEGTHRDLGLVVSNFVHEEEGRDGSHYTVELAPAEWLLTRRSGYRIFLDKTTKEIVAELLTEAGIPSSGVVWRLSGAYEKRLHCVQYQETEWAFIERLLADEGISYWCDFLGEDRPTLVLADDKSAYEGVSGAVVIPFDGTHGAAGGRHLFDLAMTESMVPTAVALRDYDVRAPTVFIEGQAGEGLLEHFEYPTSALTSAAAKARAKVRLEQLGRFKLTAEGASDCIRLQPGRVIELDTCADEWMNRRYLITSVEQQVFEGTQNDAAAGQYANRITLVPHGEIAFRPDLPRAAPRVTGLEPATTSGPAGEEIHVDDLGRVKLRFPWDRSGITDDKASYWVRCLQMGMGGTMLLPRVGWEVPVAYIDGDPDRPFVLGRTYNATMVVPYGLPGAAATTTLQSVTSPGGGGTNEIRMGDGAGKQEMFLHASKDQTITVGGSATSSVSANETHDVGLSLIANITASQSLSVGAAQSVNVGTDYATGIKGSRTEMIGGMEAIKVTANRVVNVGGAYAELIGGFYGIQCNQSNTGTAGVFTQLIGGSLNVVGGLGVAETVLAARTELVGGSKSLVALGGASDNVTGLKSITAGPTSEKAGANIVTNTKAAGSIKVGASAKIKAGGPIAIEAPTITIEAASLTTNEFSLSGGAIKIKKGTTKVKGTIKRVGGADLDNG